MILLTFDTYDCVHQVLIFVSKSVKPFFCNSPKWKKCTYYFSIYKNSLNLYVWILITQERVDESEIFCKNLIRMNVAYK